MNMNARQILIILKLRWWLVLLIFALVVGSTYAVTIFLPKRYAATASLLLDIKTDPLLVALAPNLATPSYLGTQTEIIKSDRVAARVVKMLGLADNPDAVAQWRQQSEGRVPLDTFFGDNLQRGLTVEAGRASTVLSLTYVAMDPKFAALVANSFARAYLDLSVEFRVGPAREYASFYDDRLKTLRSDLEAGQARLSDYQKKRGIVVSSERLDMESTRLTTLEAALAAALAESAETASRQRNTGTESSVDVLQSGAVQTIKSELSRAETRLNEISTTYGPNHPTRIQLDAQIAELKEQLAKEIRRVSGATTNVNRINSQKINELRSMVDGQKKTVLSMRVERDEASVLLRDLETAQRAYEQVAQRRAQLANESQAEQATARILSPAVEPLVHTYPNIPKFMTAALLMGLLGGVAAALGWELLDRRIRSEADMHMIEGVPVLGVMSTGPARRGEVRRLPPVRRPAMPPQLTLDGGAR
jgi:chain length determinant protein EpsF